MSYKTCKAVNTRTWKDLPLGAKKKRSFQDWENTEPGGKFPSLEQQWTRGKGRTHRACICGLNFVKLLFFFLLFSLTTLTFERAKSCGCGSVVWDRNNAAFLWITSSSTCNV